MLSKLELSGLQIAPRRRRIPAFIIDHFLMTLLMVGTVFFLLDAEGFENGNPFQFIATLFGVMIPGFILYFAKDSIKGISPGKWIMGIQVRSALEPEHIASFGQLFLRNLLIIIWPVEFIMLLVNDDKTRLGDRLAKTVVIENPNKSPRLPRVLAACIIPFVFVFIVLMTTTTVMKNSEAYKMSIQAIENDPELLEATGGIVDYGWIPAGNIHISNGYGQAHITISVEGKEQDAEVYTHLEKLPFSEWEIIERDWQLTE